MGNNEERGEGKRKTITVHVYILSLIYKFSPVHHDSHDVYVECDSHRHELLLRVGCQSPSRNMSAVNLIYIEICVMFSPNCHIHV